MYARYRVITITAAVGISLFGYSTFADSTNLLIGTWVLDVHKSSFDPGPPLMSHTDVITDAGNGALHFDTTFVERDGKSHHREMTASPDGKTVAVSGASDYVDSAKVTFSEPGTFHVVFKKAGKQVETGTFTVSKDGKELYGRLAGDESGSKWKYHYVSERR